MFPKQNLTRTCTVGYRKTLIVVRQHKRFKDLFIDKININKRTMEYRFEFVNAITCRVQHVFIFSIAKYSVCSNDIFFSAFPN